MQAFNDIRKQARDKRDKAIQKARDEYAETLKRIAEVEQDILGREASRQDTLATCVNRALPERSALHVNGRAAFPGGDGP